MPAMTPRLVVEVQDLKRYLQVRISLIRMVAGDPSPTVDVLKIVGMHNGLAEATFDSDAEWNSGTHLNTVSAGGTLQLGAGWIFGTWTSPVIDRGAQVDGLPLPDWTAVLPAGANMVIESRTSTKGDGTGWGDWTAQHSPGRLKPLASHRDISLYAEAAAVSRKGRGQAGSCELKINDPAGDLAGLFHRWDDLVVYQGWQVAYEATDKTKLRKFRGVILEAPVQSDTPADSYILHAGSYTVVLGRYNANKLWEGKRADEILIDALTTFGPRYVGTSKVKQNTAPQDAFKAKYDKLLKVLEDLTKITSWAGWIDDDLEFRWEDPQTNPAPVALSVAAGNIVSGSAQFKRVGPTLNDLLVFGGLVRSDSYWTDVQQGDSYRTAYPLTYNPRNITVDLKNVGDPDSAYAPVTVGTDGLNTFAEGYACLFNYKQKVIKFPAPQAGKVIRATYQYDYPVNARYRDNASVRRYGPIQDTLVDAKIRDKRAALDLAKARVREGARERWEGALRPMGPLIMETQSTWPFEPGQLIPVQIPRIKLDTRLELVEEKMETPDSGQLRVTFTLREP